MKFNMNDFQFKYGWVKEEIIKFDNKKHPIEIKLDAFTGEEITNEQKEAYLEYCQNQISRLQRAEILVSEFSEDNLGRFSPIEIIFQRDGSYAILFNDKHFPDEGIAVNLSPVEEVISQDDYL